jgi:hypothetical protein
MKIVLFLSSVSVLSVFSIPEYYIRNANKPPCIKCKHYVPDPNNAFASSTAKCNMFGGKDTHTGTIIYDDAVSVRRDDVRCSDEGKYFQSERNMIVKRAEHMIQRTGPTVVLLFLVFNFGMHLNKVYL